MHNANQNQLTIAGMGRSGQAVASYLSSMGIEYHCCDDNEDYPACSEVLKNDSGYVVKSPGIPVDKLPNVSLGNMINDVELFLRLSKKPVIMVTGTNGKSTVVSLLEHIFKANGVKAIACGNNGVPVMNAYSQRQDVYILELSSYQLENISSYQCESAVLLNIGIDHVDRYSDMQAYGSVKKKVYSSSNTSVYPIMKDRHINYYSEIDGYLGAASEGDVVYLLKSENIVRNDEIFCAVSDLDLLGRHNYLNVCAALALIDDFALDASSVIHALTSFKGLPHRMELVCEDNKGRKWINDSKGTNVHSMVAALSSQQAPVCLIVGGRGKGEDFTEVFDAYCKVIDRLIIYGEDRKLINSQASSISHRVMVDTVPDAVAVSLDCCCDVLFSPACASFDQYADFNERGEDFKQQVIQVTSC